MARRRAPARRWHVGDACRVPTEGHTVYPPYHNTHWQRAEVVAVRGDRVVVRCYGWERVHPWWEVCPPLKPRGNCRWRTNWQGRKSRPSPSLSGLRT
jgi:hypothetical protein